MWHVKLNQTITRPGYRDYKYTYENSEPIETIEELKSYVFKNFPDKPNCEYEIILTYKNEKGEE